jgi:ElaB/YqjD/DUF883 family membrane-anchored ribosome-binding protein
MSTENERICEQAKEVIEGVEKMGGAVSDAAREKLGQVGDRASDCCGQVRERAHGIACQCEQFLRQKPLTCVVLAAGLGWLFGRLGKRR